MTIQRPLGNYERFSLARHNVHQAPAVAFTALLPSTSLTRLDRTNLLKAIAALLQREPLLRSSVADPKTPEPKFSLEDTVEGEKVLIEPAATGVEADTALLEALQTINDLDIEKAPLWRVWLYAEDPETKLRRIVVGVHHVLGDGSAARNLFTELLTLLRTSSNDQKANTLFPPSLEDTVDVRPSTLSLVKTVFSELLVPKLPSFLRPTPPTPFWPNPALVLPVKQPTALKLVFLPSHLSRSLAANSKSHQVKTLQPIFVICAFTAIANIGLSDKNAPESLRIDSQTPVSLRSTSLGHPLLSGNYVSSIPSSSSPISRSTLTSTKFWSEARSMAAHLSSPASHIAAKGAMGMLAYIPAGDASTPEKGQRTGWEEFIEGRMESENPWRGGSFEVSNLGRIPISQEMKEWEQEGMREVCWAQPGSSTGTGLQFNVSNSLFLHRSERS